MKVAFQGSRITSDASLILVRELDERLGLAGGIAAHLRDSRHGLNTQFRLPDLLRQSVYSRLAGYEDLNDAVRFAVDPTSRLIGSPTRWDRSAVLTSTLHWFETELLAREENLVGLMAVNRDLIGQAETCDGADRVVLDMDSSESPVHGQQEGSAYIGHFESVCYHPLFLFNDHGDCLAAKLRSGNVHSTDDWDALLVPEIERQQAAGRRVAVRADAAFAKPEIYEALETRAVQYAIRMPANKNLEIEIEDLLFRSPGCGGLIQRIQSPKNPVRFIISMSPFLRACTPRRRWLPGQWVSRSDYSGPFYRFLGRDGSTRTPFGQNTVPAQFQRHTSAPS